MRFTCVIFIGNLFDVSLQLEHIFIPVKKYLNALFCNYLHLYCSNTIILPQTHK